jgi:hypothetical protein
MLADPLKIFFPGKLVFGNGTLAQLPEDVLQLKPSKSFYSYDRSSEVCNQRICKHT